MIDLGDEESLRFSEIFKEILAIKKRSEELGEMSLFFSVIGVMYIKMTDELKGVIINVYDDLEKEK